MNVMCCCVAVLLCCYVAVLLLLLLLLALKSCQVDDALSFNELELVREPAAGTFLIAHPLLTVRLPPYTFVLYSCTPCP
jgi:hypothetical protein